MHAAEVVVEEIQCNLMPVVLNLFAVSVRQSRESSHPHSHRKILPFDIACADVFRIRFSTQYSCAASDARCWTIARFGIVVRCAVNLDQHRVVDLRAKGILYGLSVYAMAVCG